MFAQGFHPLIPFVFQAFINCVSECPMIMSVNVTDRQTKKKQHQRLYEETYEVGSGSSVSLHEGPQVLEDLGAPIDRTRRRRRTVLVVDNNEAILDGDKVEAEGTHVQEHSRDIQQGGKEEQASPSENRRHEDEDELLHLLLGGRAC